MRGKIESRWRLRPTLLFLMILLPFLLFGGALAGKIIHQPPVKNPTAENLSENVHYKIRNLFSNQTLQAAFHDGNASGLLIDFSDACRLLNGEKIDPAQIHGKAVFGPYPFQQREADYAYKRFRGRAKIRNGKGTLDLSSLFSEVKNSARWVDSGTVAVRLILTLERPGRDTDLGAYDLFLRFKKENGRFLRAPTVSEGPFVQMVHSGDSTRMMVYFETDREVRARVSIGQFSFEDPEPARRHRIPISGLVPDTEYAYRVAFDDYESRDFTFRTAPDKGEGTFRFAFAGDSRDGNGGGELEFMGLNHQTLERLFNTAYLEKAAFFLFGGDLVTGYTTGKDDLLHQFRGWRQAAAGYWNHRPVYVGMGNHDALIRRYDDGSEDGVRLDRWPYETEGSETVFREVFDQFENGPRPSDPRRPEYLETVFAFQYGPLTAIAFNNNYWMSTHANRFGGSPEGYILPDQMSWIERQLKQAQADPTVRYVILFAQEPVFPNGGHAEDSMWYHGDNRVRAHTYEPDTGRLVPEKEGIIEVRNHLVTLVGRYPKVAAVLTADEHGYHRTLIDSDTPVGVYRIDDPNGNGKVCEKEESCSPLPFMEFPVWFITSGGAGAPYYAEQSTPWNRYWKANPEACEEHKEKSCYRFSSQEHFLLFEVGPSSLSMSVRTPYGEVIDHVDNLMAVKLR